MFSNSKYTFHYELLIARARNRPAPEGYCERHHVIPRSLGGSDEMSNIVTLTAREHFIAHLLLSKMCICSQHRHKMVWALHRMAFSCPLLSSKEYELARVVFSKNLKNYHQSKTLEQKQQFADKSRDRMLQLWETDLNRRQKQAAALKKRRLQNPEKWRQISIQNLPAPQLGKNNAKTIEIEYQGILYYGWRELQEQTGITKHLYNKYYLLGINPMDRIGKNGPVPINSK